MTPDFVRYLSSGLSGGSTSSSVPLRLQKPGEEAAPVAVSLSAEISDASFASGEHLNLLLFT